MKTIRKNFILLAFAAGALFFHSCQFPAKDNAIDLNANDEVSVFDIFSEVSVIHLTTQPSELLANIAVVKYFDSHYYILDDRTQKIFCFDEQGNQVFKIDAQGNGPGEYNYINYFSIDTRNEQLVVLDPVVQRVHFFDFFGRHVLSHTFSFENVLGLSKAYMLTDSLILLTSITYEHLIYYCLKSEKVVFSDYDFSSRGVATFTLFLYNYVYKYNNRYFGLLPFSQQLADFTDIPPVEVFYWNFGKSNNTPKQWDRLLSELENKGEKIFFYHDAVGKDKILNHYIFILAETNLFRLAIVEFDNDYKHVFVNKKEGSAFVFDSFMEGVRLVFSFFQEDRVILAEPPGFESIREKFPPELAHRSYKIYDLELLSNEDRQIIENHNPMTDNPFLVVYKFRE